MYPGPPPGRPDDDRPADAPRRRDDADIRLPQYRGDDPDSTLTGGDIALCILCSGIACILGIVYAVQGKPKGGKMILLAFVCSMVWGVIRVAIQNSR